MSETGNPERRKNRLKKKHLAYLGIGSNIEPVRNLPQAIELLQKHVTIQAISQVWETPPAGTRGPSFLNAALLVCTPLPSGLLKSLVLRPIEIQMRRIRTPNKNAPRTIDLDILVFDNQIADPKLWSQAFNAVPLAELLPDLINPATGETLREVAQRLSQSTSLTLRPDVVLSLPKT